MLFTTGCTLFNDSKDDLESNSNSNKDSVSESNKSEPKEDTEVDAISPSSNTFDNLDNEITNWFYMPNDTHTTPNINPKLTYDLSSYDAFYNNKTNQRSSTVYLTFDEGYENGQTPQILDTLKDKNVKAVFFVTYPYVKSNPDLINRMVDEGHIVASHSKNHPSMPTTTSDVDKFNEEFKAVEEEFKSITNKDLTKYFRPPMGCYSEKSLAMTQELGYKTVFWSFAYEDWDPEKQPEPEYAKNKILDNLHDGSILLLHAVSQTNADILGDVIDSAIKEGYSFELLDL